MGIADDIIKILDEFGEVTKVDLTKSIDSKTNVQTSLGASIKFEYAPLTGGLRFVLRLNDYYEIVDKGRGTGNVSKEGQESIKRWGQKRGIFEKLRIKDLQTRVALQAKNKTDRPKKTLKKKDFQKFSKGMAYVIARNIERRGYKGNNFFTDVMDDGRLEKLTAKLTELIGSNFQIELYK